MDHSKSKPNLEDVLFLNKSCKHELGYENSVYSKRSFSIFDFCPPAKLDRESLENLIKDELKGKHYPEFVQHFKINAKDCTLKSAKNPQSSIGARIKGNVLFARKEHDVDVHTEIWKLYSTSVAFAPIGSKELVLAYECRSNLLLHFKKYEDCIKDIDRALSITEFDLLKVKLLTRKMTCFVALNKKIVEKQHLWKILKFHLDKIDGAFKDEKFLKMIKQAENDVSIEPDKKVKDEKKNFTPLTSLSDITLSNNKERCIIANRDFEVGEPVIITKPLITSVNPDKFYAYCSHCLTFMWAGIPCDKCSLCMYCSEECKKEAWEKYHILECKVYPHIDFKCFIYYQLACSIKIFLMGIREFGGISKLLKKVQEVEEMQAGDPKFPKDDQFFDSEFLNFYTLPNISLADSCSLSNAVKNTCFLMAYLIQTLDDVFEKEVGSMKGKELAKNKDFVLSTYVMLKIMILCDLHIQYPVGKRIPKCTKYDSADECMINRCCHIGRIFCFFNGLLEKSCNSNVAICKTIDGKIIYYCTQPIKKMEMITVEETVPFYQCDLAKRSILTASIKCLHEICKCIACEKNWPPVLKEFRKFETKFWRRSNKVQTKGTEFLEKYLYGQNEILNNYEKFVEHKCSIANNEDEFQELAKDANTVISTCGQPSLASTWMIMILRQAFQYLFGDPSFQSLIPDDC